MTGIWSGATNGAWDGGTANFTGGQFFATVSGLTTSVSFADTDGFKNAVTNSNITVGAGGASIGTVNFLNNAVNYTFNSADANGITGASNVNKTGTGTVTFSGANTYTGTTSVSNGILTFGNTAARSSGTTVTTAAAGTVGLGVGAVSGDFSDADVAALFNTNTLTGFNLDAASGVAIDTTAGNFTQSTALTAARPLTKLGNNILTLTGANTYAGATSVNRGILTFANTATKSPSTTVTAAATGTIGLGVGAVSGDYSDADVAALFNTNTLTGFNLNAASGVALDTSAGNFTQSTALTAARALTKLGNNTLTLTGANTYAGATTIASGTLELAGTAGTLGTGPVTNNGTLLINRTNALSLTNAISGTGALTKAGTGTAKLSGTSTYSGPTSITGGTLSLSVTVGAARQFDASGLGLANGGSVTTWSDSSGNGANASVPGGNAAPTFIANAGTGTGLGAINFTAGTGGNSANNSQAITFARDTNVRSIFSIFKGSSFLITDSNNYGFHRPSDTNPADPLLSADFGTDMPAVIGGTAFVNGVQVNPQTFAMPTSLRNGYNLVAMTTNGTPVAVNGFNKDRTFHSGNQSQAEVIIFDTVVSNAQRLQIETFLTKKWFGTGPGIGNLLPTTTAVTISSGGTLDISGENFQTIASLSSTDGTGNKLSLGAAALTFGDANDNTFDGAISGAGSLTKIGSGKQTLSGASTFSGRTTISNGTLELGGAAGKLGTGPITNNSTLRFNPSTTLSVPGAIDGTGGLTQAGTGTTTLTGALTYSGATDISGGTLRIVGATTSPVAGTARHFDASNLGLANGAGVSTWNDLSGNGANATVPGGNATPTYIANAGTGTGLGAINLPKNGGAATSGAFSFTRDANVRSMFSIFKGNSFLATDNTGGTYALHRPTDDNAADPLLADYGQINYLGSVYVNGALVGAPLSTPMPTNVANGYNLVEVITNGNAFALDSFNKDRGNLHAGNQSQAEVLIYDTVLTESQRLHNESYLSNKWFGTGAAAALPSNTPVTISGGGTLDLIGAQTIGSLSSTDALGSKVINDTSLTVGNATSTTFDGVISGPGTLTKVGNGTLTLAGASTYTGPTTVNAGTLIVSGSISGSAVTVDGSGSTLGGGGTINGTVTVQNQATVAPGNSPGKLSTLSLTMASGTTLSLELNGPTPVTGYDQLSVTGAVNLGGATLSISTGVGFVNGDYFVVLNDGSDAITGTFNGLNEGGMFSVGDKDFTITYTANAEGMSLTGGNDVAFTVVPEPGSAMLLLGGIATMLGVRRRRVQPS